MQGRLDRGGVAFEGSLGDQRHVALGHRFLDSSQAGKAERIILVEDRDSGNAEVIGQMLDPGFGFLEIRAANIDDISIRR